MSSSTQLIQLGGAANKLVYYYIRYDYLLQVEITSKD